MQLVFKQIKRLVDSVIFKMPSKKYYRSLLPNDVLQIVGNYAGDSYYKLVFTYSNKRKFLSTIRLIPRKSGCIETILHKQLWRPVRIGHYEVLTNLIDALPSNHNYIFMESFLHIYRILHKVHDYTLKPKIDKW